MKQLSLFFCLLLSGIATAQHAAKEDNTIVTIADQMPAFPGGEKAKAAYFQQNMSYPQIEKTYGVQGIAFVTFVVEKDGSISNVRCIKPVKTGPHLNKEAIRLVKAMPKWTPGLQRNKPVRVQYIMPIKFSLPSSKPLTDDQMQMIAMNHYQQGVELIAQQKYKEALRALDYTIFYLPTDINTLYERGIAYHGLNDDKSACDQWSQIKFMDDSKADEMISKYCK